MALSRDIKTDYEEFWLRGKDAWSPYWHNAERGLKAVANKSWTDKEIRILERQGREALEFPFIRSYVNLFSGHFRDNMKSLMVGPQEENDLQKSDDWTEILIYIYQHANAMQITPNVFDDIIKTGMALFGVWMDYSNDTVNGDIKFFKRSYNSFVIDPNWERLDFSDVSEVLLRDFVTREQAKVMLPMVDSEVIDEAPSYINDNKFNLLRRNNHTSFRYRDMLSYDSYYTATTRQARIILNAETGEEREILDDSIEDEDLERIIQQDREQYGSEVELITKDKQTVDLHIFLSGEHVWSGRDPTGLDTYPFRAGVCYWEPQLDDFGIKVQGIAYNLLDVQRTFNKRQCKFNDIIDSNANSGYFYKASSLVNQDSMNESGTVVNTAVKQGANIQSDFVPKQQGAPLPGWLEYMQTLPELGMKLAGINETLMGQDEGGNTQVSGRLAEVRAANGLKANRSVFDNMEILQKMVGELVLETAQRNYSPQKIERILGREPDPDFFDQNIGKFDLVTKQGIQTQSQRDAFYFELIKLREILGPEAVSSKTIMENLPMTGITKVLKDVSEQEEQAKQLQQQREQDDQLLRQLQMARIDADKALTELRKIREVKEFELAKVKASQVQENIAGAQLDKAKAIAEIKKMSDNRIIDVLRFLQEFDESKEEVDQDLAESSVAVEQITQLANETEQQPPAEQAQMPAPQEQPPGGL